MRRAGQLSATDRDPDNPRVAIDTRSLHRGPPGVATYVSHLLEHLPWLDRLESPGSLNNMLWNCVRVPLAQLRSQWQVSHAPSYTCPLVGFCPVAMTVHDISYLAHPEWYPYRQGFLRIGYYRASLRRADRILVPSRFSGREIVRLFPDLKKRIRRIPMGVSDYFSPDPALAEEISQRMQLPSRFILHVGDLHARRNLALLGRVATAVGLPLVLVGRSLEGNAVPENSLHLSNVSKKALKGIYSAASVFVYPSLYEGFGLPLLEAMACGVPVVGSNRASLPEVCGQAALLVEPEQGALVAAIQQALRDRASFRQRGLERARQFPWKQTAAATLQVYRELAG